MPWFVASRPVLKEGRLTEELEYRVFSEEDVEDIGPEWDWASSAFDTREEAQVEADDLFWDGLER